MILMPENVREKKIDEDRLQTRKVEFLVTSLVQNCGDPAATY